MASTGPFRPHLRNNSDATDYVIYSIEQANPGRAFATNWWGSLVQTSLFTALIMSLYRYYRQFRKEDGYATLGIVTMLTLLTTADFITHQITSFQVASTTSPISGTGIQDHYYDYYIEVLTSCYLVCFLQFFVLTYFGTRAYKLWGSNIWIAILVGSLILGLTVIGLYAVSYANFPPVNIWVNKRMDITALLKAADEYNPFAQKCYNLMTAWTMTAFAVDLAVSILILIALYRHHRQAVSMRNMKHVRTALQRAMLFMIESMTLILIVQLVMAIGLKMNLGLSHSLRALMAIRTALHAFAVVWSLNSRAAVKDMLEGTQDRTVGAISFSSAGTLVSTKGNSRHNPTSSGKIPDLELLPYDSTQNLVRVDTLRGSDHNHGAIGREEGFGDAIGQAPSKASM